VTTDGERWVDRACAAVLRHLGDNRPATSIELRAGLPELARTCDPAPGKRWGGAVPIAPRVLTLLSARGDIVRGPNDRGVGPRNLNRCEVSRRAVADVWCRGQTPLRR